MRYSDFLIFIFTLFAGATYSQDGFSIVYPNGGEVIYIGDTLNIKVSSTKAITSSLTLRVGKYNWNLSNTPFNAQTDTIHEFIVPDSMERRVWDDVQGAWTYPKVSLVSDECKIVIGEYNNESNEDESDSFFSIRPTTEKPQPTSGTKSNSKCGSGWVMALILPFCFKISKRIRLAV